MGPDPERFVLKADPQVQELLLTVQRHDLEVDRVVHRRATLAEAARVSELQTSARLVADRLTAAQTEVSDLEAEQRKADADVDLVRQRAAKDQNLLDSGSINDAKQLSSLQHELESLARRQSDLEDIELEIMERLDDAQKNLRNITAEQQQVAASLEEAIAARDVALAALADEQSVAAAARTESAAGIPAGLLELYDRLRADNGGIGAAPLHRGRCEGCRIELTPVDIGRIREAAPDDVLRCEECRRILVRTAESGL